MPPDTSVISRPVNKNDVPSNTTESSFAVPLVFKKRHWHTGHILVTQMKWKDNAVLVAATANCDKLSSICS